MQRDEMIPMRDGVKLHTVILVSKDARNLPMILERTPYDAEGTTKDRLRLRDAVWAADRDWVDDGYILVYQDVRGKYGAEGKYVMTRPPGGRSIRRRRTTRLTPTTPSIG